VVVAWVVVLGATIGLGLLGQGTARPATTASTTGPVAADADASPVTRVAPPDVAPARPASRDIGRARATRPPIGEDGVMGGLVFGTAWHWLEPVRADRP
jgi:hypothetical protein